MNGGISSEQQRLQVKKEVEDIAVYFDLIQDIQGRQSPEMHFWLAEMRRAVAEMDKHIIVLTDAQRNQFDADAREFHLRQLQYGQQKIVEIYNDVQSSTDLLSSEQRQHVLKIIADLSATVDQLVPV